MSVSKMCFGLISTNRLSVCKMFVGKSLLNKCLLAKCLLAKCLLPMAKHCNDEEGENAEMP
jgi:hypothetical protein